ncbi:MAG: SRPBCC family protein [Planctomycetia bacterium]|nr:SRPBCC family protein [Planctomycetia bacterium]
MAELHESSDNVPDNDSGSQPASGAEPSPPGVLWVLNLWFGFSLDVTSLAYAASGLGLMALKYGVEAGAIYSYTGRFFSPLDFLNPLLSMRQEFFKPPAPDWLAWSLFCWTLPFLWIAVSMSVRRATNAGLTAWFGLIVLVPLVNYFGMILLALLPRRAGISWANRKVRPSDQQQMKSALIGIAVSTGIALVMVGVGVYGFKEYGATLFLGTPIWMGAVSAFLYNRPYPRSLGGSLLVAEVSILITGLALLLFAFEGVICLAMLFPVAGAMGLLGGLIGYALGAMTATRGKTMMFVFFLLPAGAGAESQYRPVPTFEVETAVEIDAPPEAVWPHVVGFADLPAPPNWYFQLGIAYPKRATIEGSGVGAVRHCEFSTGAFVEPITVWEPPHRLAFDVAAQPPPMHELSPYRHVHPPHLDGYLRCRRGEFRLVPLDDGRTRLEGSTWYEFAMYPQDYWTLWSDAVIHRIHRRVLEHIKRLSEQDGAE